MLSRVSPKKSRRTGFCRPGGEEIEDAAAYRELALLHHRAGTRIAGERKPGHQPVEIHPLPRRDALHGVADERPRRHAFAAPR